MIARELVAIQPAPDTESFQRLREMAEVVAGETPTLADVVVRFVTTLESPEASDSLVEEITAIGKMESRCDEIKYELLTTAFATEEIDAPLVYRELAILVDDLANTMENVTDRIVVISSDEPGLVTEPDPDQE